MGNQSLGDLVDNKRVTPWTMEEALKFLLHQTDGPRLSVATAYFNLDALSRLEEALTQLKSLRLLLGKEQEQTFLVSQKLFAEIQDSLSKGKTTAPQVKKWEDYLRQDWVEIRVYKKGFLHGKAYLVQGVPAFGEVGFVGSSNFTGAGLSSNAELNAVIKQASGVEELKRWFDALWDESEDYKQEILEMLTKFTQQYTPYEIYIKTVYEAYRDKLGSDLSEEDGKPSPIALADFQHDGYLAAMEILDSYNGVLIADSVGLGKTFLALRLLDDYAYKARQTALIICPAALIDTLWRPLLQRFSIPHEIVSMERVSQRDFSVEEYAKFKVLVIDEAHNFRNPNANRWQNLFRLVTSNNGDKKVLLLTATPVNNTVFDLYHQLRIITRDARDFFVAANIPDLYQYFIQAEKNRDTLYEVLEAIAVRRSRRFIRANYPNAEIDGQKVSFPERKLHSVRYRLEASYGKELYGKIADAIENLFLAPYQVDAYRKEIIETSKHFFAIPSLSDPESQVSSQLSRLMDRLQKLGWAKAAAQNFAMSFGRQTALAHIMRVLYLKRLESSVHALKISLTRQRDFQKAFLTALNQGRLLKAPDYRKWLQTETTDDQAEREEELS
ncbi:MAG: phospholipase D-like domain-containing protein, partial [Armatimonadota bacterium]|nr:phospholipase D-like domain-containing protein [Armatimonadota bacterium]